MSFNQQWKKWFHYCTKRYVRLRREEMLKEEMFMVILAKCFHTHSIIHNTYWDISTCSMITISSLKFAVEI